MNTTISFNYTQTRQYAIELFNTKSEAYTASKKAEALLILIGIDTGLRVTDLLNLKFTDIQISEDYGKPLVTAYIGKKKRKEIKPLSTSTHRLIETYANYVRYSLNGTSDLIFMNYANDKGKVFSRQWAHKRINKANDKGLLGKKVDVAGAHSLRRTAGAHIYEQTKDLRDVQFLLGHDRIKQTEHYLKHDQTKALDRLTRLYE